MSRRVAGVVILFASSGACSLVTGLSAYEITSDNAGIDAGNARWTSPATCGIELARTIELASGDDAATVDVTMDPSEVFSLGQAVNGSIRLQLAAHQHTAFTLKAKPTRAGSASTDVVIKIAGEGDHHIAVSLTTAGGSLALGTSSADFGTVPENTGSPRQSVTPRQESRSRSRAGRSPFPPS